MTTLWFTGLAVGLLSGFSLGWLVGRDWDAGVFARNAKLPTARSLRRNRLALPGDRVWRHR